LCGELREDARHQVGERRVQVNVRSLKKVEVRRHIPCGLEGSCGRDRAAYVQRAKGGELGDQAVAIRPHRGSKDRPRVRGERGLRFQQCRVELACAVADMREVGVMRVVMLIVHRPSSEAIKPLLHLLKIHWRPSEHSEMVQLEVEEDGPLMEILWHVVSVPFHVQGARTRFSEALDGLV
jgi:hypothetical protein